MQQPQVNDLCWLFFEGAAHLGRIYHVTKCFYHVTNEHSFINNQGELIGPKSLYSIPPGHKNATFRPYVLGAEKPEYNAKTGLPADMQSDKPNPLFNQ